MKYKMIVSDFDGTLYTDDFKVSDVTIAAVRDYKKAGGLFFIATGRLYDSIKVHSKLFDLVDEVIVYQGGAIIDLKSDEIIMEYNINTNVSAKIYNYINDNYPDACIPILFHNDKCIVVEENYHITNFCNVVKVEPVYTGKKLGEFVVDNNIKPNKILALVEKDRSEEIAKDIIAKFGDVVNINRSASILIEIVDKSASKGDAVKWLTEKYNIKREEVICFGDAENDISMLKYAGLGVAVGNAMETAKAVADLVCDTNNNDGVAKVIREIAMKE